jgi:hypothetical protein
MNFTIDNNSAREYDFTYINKTDVGSSNRKSHGLYCPSTQITEFQITSKSPLHEDTKSFNQDSLYLNSINCNHCKHCHNCDDSSVFRNTDFTEDINEEISKINLSKYATNFRVDLKQNKHKYNKLINRAQRFSKYFKLKIQTESEVLYDSLSDLDDENYLNEIIKSTSSKDFKQ